MEIIYSLFNRPLDEEAELRFRIKLNKKDYVLINQFSNDVFEHRFPMLRESRIESSIFRVEEDKNPDFIILAMNWGKDTYEKKYDDDKNIYWISKEEFSITLSQKEGVSFSPDSMVEKIQGGVTRLMRKKQEVIPDKDNSYFEKTIPIEYVDSK